MKRPDSRRRFSDRKNGSRRIVCRGSGEHTSFFGSSWGWHVLNTKAQEDVPATRKSADTFAEASALASKEGAPIVIYVHGSSWHPASRLFGEKIWSSAEFRSTLPDGVVLTDIHLKQLLDEEAAKAQAKELEGWNRKTIRTFPALQVFGADGHLLKTVQGREMREIISPAILSKIVQEALVSMAQRKDLLAEIEAARQKKDAEKELEALIRLVELSLNPEEKIAEQLKAVDPDDRSGWQARLGFREWEFVRHISGMIKEGKTKEAVAEADRLLEISRHRPEQRALILGAKATVLVKQAKLSEAWVLFEEAKATDPEGPNGKAMWRYGVRVAGLPLRATLPKGSSLNGKELGENLSRGHASFTMSSSQHDNPEFHSSLFGGPFAPSGFAFHTGSEKDAHIVIDLQGECEIRALLVTNRASSKERAESLTLGSSSDGKEWQTQWQTQWQAGEVLPFWGIHLETPVKARFLKLGLDRKTPEFFHLTAVDIYGKRS
jgi:hypothetical protein